MQKLKGKVAFVTGSSRRIGAEVVKKLHSAGADMVVHYRNSFQEADQLCVALNQIRANSCMLQQGELTNVDVLPTMIANVLDHYGRLDILINNASSFYPTPVGDIRESDWDNLVGSNLKAPLFLSQAAAAELKKRGGCIVNMADVHGFRPLKGYPVYSVAKAGLIMLTQSLARELGPEVRVNAIAPGAILWPETDEASGSDAEHQALLNKTSLLREGCPDDIAKAVLFLVQDADYITGHTLPVDGGRMLNH